MGWRHRIVAATYLARGIPPLFEKLGGRDIVSTSGGDFRYAVPAQFVDYVRVQSGFEVGAWRGIAAGYTKFAIETVIDEIAQAKGVDPLDLYLSICALGFFVFSNRHTLGVIFNTDVTSTAALRKRRALVVDMIKAYLAP